MNQKIPSPKVQAIAKELLVFEASADLVEEHTPAMFRVSEKLREALSRLAGTTAFRALLAEHWYWQKGR